MGVINLDPLSFYNASKAVSPEAALEMAEKMVAEGASIIDVGGEATQPKVSDPHEQLAVERERVVPVVTHLTQHLSIPVSVDTSKPDIMHEVVDAGASIINDVRALRLPGALETVAALDVPVCLMHMAHPDGVPKDIDLASSSSDEPIDEIKRFLRERVRVCLEAGIKEKNLIVDPGIGAGSFGKTLSQNLKILATLDRLKDLNLPILVGVSRKTFIGELLDQTAEERLPGSLAATIAAVNHGANIIRTHDVKATHDAIKMTVAIKEGSEVYE